LTLAANGVVDDGEVTSVAFYRDDGGGTLDAGDTLLDTDTDGTDGWAATISIPSDFPEGVYVYFGQATDNDGQSSNVVSTTNEVKKATGGGNSGEHIDALMAAVGLSVPPADPAFDVNADGVINTDDRDVWLAEAAAAEGYSAPFLLGDANLDGTVGAEDLDRLRISWRQTDAVWSDGDINGDGVVNAIDLNELALNWQQSILGGGPSSSN
jgi:hypothetical protein